MVKEGRRDELWLLFRRALFLTTLNLDGLKPEWRGLNGKPVYSEAATPQIF